MPIIFSGGISYLLTVNGVKDLAGNTLVNGTSTFVYFAPYTAQQYDVVIDEIMSDSHATGGHYLITNG